MAIKSKHFESLIGKRLTFDCRKVGIIQGTLVSISEDCLHLSDVDVPDSEIDIHSNWMLLDVKSIITCSPVEVDDGLAKSLEELKHSLRRTHHPASKAKE